jgi:hypothetical protein
LKIEIDKLRSEQKHLEKQVRTGARVLTIKIIIRYDSHIFSQLKAETERVSVVATQNDAALEDLRRKHGQEVALLRSKLAWYTENQELLQQKDEQLEQQARNYLTFNLESLIFETTAAGIEEAAERIACSKGRWSHSTT